MTNFLAIWALNYFAAYPTQGDSIPFLEKAGVLAIVSALPRLYVHKLFAEIAQQNQNIANLLPDFIPEIEETPPFFPELPFIRLEAPTFPFFSIF